MRLRRVVTCGLPRCMMFFYIISQTARFSKNIITVHKTRVSILSTTFVWNISRPQKNLGRYDQYDQKCILLLMWSACFSCEILMKLEFSWQIFIKNTQIQISWKSVQWEEPSSSTQMDRQTDMKKLISLF